MSSTADDTALDTHPTILLTVALFLNIPVMIFPMTGGSTVGWVLGAVRRLLLYLLAPPLPLSFSHAGLLPDSTVSLGTHMLRVAVYDAQQASKQISHGPMT